jgi:DNA-binding Lrp family transcriptional regulator
MENIQEINYKLDKKDSEILYELSLDSRRPLTEVKKTVGMSEQAMTYRIKRLVRRKILSGFIPYLNFDCMGLRLFRAYIGVQRKASQKDEILETLRKGRNVLRVESLFGKYDLSADFAARNASEFARAFSQTTADLGKELGSCSTSEIISSLIYKRKYLAPHLGSGMVASQSAGSVKMEKLGDKDIRIISELLADGKKTNLSIGKKLKISQSSVRNRILNLQKRGIIQGIGALIKPQAFGGRCKELLLSMEERPDIGNRMLEFAKLSPNTIRYERMFGRWNYQLSLEYRDRAQLKDTINGLREKFAGSINDYELVDKECTHEFDYSPVLKL